MSKALIPGGNRRFEHQETERESRTKREFRVNEKNLSPGHCSMGVGSHLPWLSQRKVDLVRGLLFHSVLLTHYMFMSWHELHYWDPSLTNHGKETPPICLAFKVWSLLLLFNHTVTIMFSTNLTAKNVSTHGMIQPILKGPVALSRLDFKTMQTKEHAWPRCFHESSYNFVVLDQAWDLSDMLCPAHRATLSLCSHCQ